MSYVSLQQVLSDARQGGYAAGAFNIVNYITAEAVVAAAEAAGKSVILQTSVSTVRQIGIEPLIGFLIPMAKAAGVGVAVHLDHATSADLCIKCLEAGWSGVMYDGSKLPYEQNLADMRRVAARAHELGAGAEGEIGAIMGVEDDIAVINGALADPGTALSFAREAGIDALAPAIGTAHGLYKGVPQIDFARFAAIEREAPCPLVVHGGTGLADGVFRRLVSLGAAKINVSTAIKIAYIDSFMNYVRAHEGEYNPLKADAAVKAGVQAAAARHIAVFSGTEAE